MRLQVPYLLLQGGCGGGQGAAIAARQITAIDLCICNGPTRPYCHSKALYSVHLGRAPVILSKEEIEAEKAQLKAIDSRPIKKVAEAKARKKKRLAVRSDPSYRRALAASPFVLIVPVDP